MPHTTIAELRELEIEDIISAMCEIQERIIVEWKTKKEMSELRSPDETTVQRIVPL